MNSGMCNPGLARLQMITGVQAPGMLLDRAKLKVRNPRISRTLPSEGQRSTLCFTCLRSIKDGAFALPASFF